MSLLKAIKAEKDHQARNIKNRLVVTHNPHFTNSGGAYVYVGNKTAIGSHVYKAGLKKARQWAMNASKGDNKRYTIYYKGIWYSCYHKGLMISKINELSNTPLDGTTNNKPVKVNQKLEDIKLVYDLLGLPMVATRKQAINKLYRGKL